MDHLRSRVGAVVCGAAAAALGLAGTAALAQITVEEVTVMGHDARPETMSYRVSYHDLDLRTEAGQKELRRRVAVTADYVCGRLGERRGVGTPCRTNAIDEARPRINAAIKHARLSTVAWKPGPGWVPPPTD
jgi:UrcA family protein